MLFHCGLIRDGASSGIRHLGPPVANVVLCSAVVVSCRKEGAERLTAGGVSRQDTCRVWNHDACQLCKAGLSPRISLKKEKLKKKKNACPQRWRRLSSARLGFLAQVRLWKCSQNSMFLKQIPPPGNTSQYLSSGSLANSAETQLHYRYAGGTKKVQVKILGSAIWSAIKLFPLECFQCCKDVHHVSGSTWVRNWTRILV